MQLNIKCVRVMNLNKTFFYYIIHLIRNIARSLLTHLFKNKYPELMNQQRKTEKLVE